MYRDLKETKSVENRDVHSNVNYNTVYNSEGRA